MRFARLASPIAINAAALLVTLVIAAPARSAQTPRIVVAPTGEAAGNLFGIGIGGAGDVNGDGRADFLVGAGGYNGFATSVGRAYLYYGGAPINAAPDLLLNGEETLDNFGDQVAAAGDVNHDGWDDFMVTVPTHDGVGRDSGRGYIFFGGPGLDAVPDWVLNAARGDDLFGTGSSTAGDINDDGFDEIVIGAPRNDAGGPLLDDRGRVYVYFGGVAPDIFPDLTFTGEAPIDNFGASVAGGLDVNADGYPDIVAGARWNDAGGTDAGRAYVFFGGPGADAVADLTLTGAAAGDEFGKTVSLGDVNGDGFADVLVAAPLHDAGGPSNDDRGRVYVFHGGPGLDAVADFTLTGEAAGDQFGRGLSGGGDVDLDGFDDLAVGAPLEDAGGGPNIDRGRVYVFYGGPALDAVADLVLDGEAPGDFLGLNIAMVGDTDDFPGDEVLAGARFNDASAPNAGRAYLFGLPVRVPGASPAALALLAALLVAAGLTVRARTSSSATPRSRACR